MKRCGLRFVTSSIEKKELIAAAEKNQSSGAIQKEETNEKNAGEREEEENAELKISACAACGIAVVDGSFEVSNESVDTVNVINTEVGSLMANTDSITEIVAAYEEVKQAVADDLKSTSSSPCEWFICDDDQSSTRYFVIQVGKLVSDMILSRDIQYIYIYIYWNYRCLVISFT